MCKRYYIKYILSICNQITTPCCVCVLPIGRSILIVSFPWLSSLQICVSCHFQWFSSVLQFWVSQEAILFTLPSITKWSRSPWRNLYVPAKLHVTNFLLGPKGAELRFRLCLFLLGPQGSELRFRLCLFLYFNFIRVAMWCACIAQLQDIENDLRHSQLVWLSGSRSWSGPTTVE